MGHPFKMTAAANSQKVFYPIRKISELTGINPVTLRAWERRYGLIKPERTPKGHRLYTDEHVQLIRRILDLIDQGVSIGQVKKLLANDKSPADSEEQTAVSAIDPWETYRSRLLQAIARFDEAALDAGYNDCLSLYPLELVTRLLLLPLLHELHQRQARQPQSDPELHFFQTYLRNKLGARFHHMTTQARGRRLLAACLPGEFSEVDLLLFGLAALTRGYRIVLLGPSMPLESLPLTMERSQCEALVLFGSIEPPLALLRTHLPAMTQKIQQPVFIGGSIAQAHVEALRQAGLIPLVSDIAGALMQVDDRLQPRST
jgi:DNA-binding transcriptional MerR regulator